MTTQENFLAWVIVVCVACGFVALTACAIWGGVKATINAWRDEKP